MKASSLVLLLSVGVTLAVPEKPHIVLMQADDLGWGDVGFTYGSGDIRTSNIDAIAMHGVVFDRFYSSPMCTPSRAAFQTGKDPCTTGMQSSVLFAEERRGLPLEYELLPQHLKKQGYKNHLIGKWHLGNCHIDYTPTYRGYDDFLGYWTGHRDYYDHFAEERDPFTLDPVTGLDARRGTEVDYDHIGTYSTDLFTDEAERIIKAHNRSEPLFLHLSHSAPHAANSNAPLQAPQEAIDECSHIKDDKRRTFCGMMWQLDQSVGRVCAALKDADLLQDAIIFFLSDNGATRMPEENNVGSNYPFKGEKNTMYEGAVRIPAAVWAPWLKKPRTIIRDKFHMVDMMPTLYAAAGGDATQLKGIDGINHWPNIVNGDPLQRTEVLVNIDQLQNMSAVIVGDFKYIRGASSALSNFGPQDGHYGVPPPDVDIYRADETLNSPASKALEFITSHKLTEEEIKTRRENIRVKCNSDTTDLTCNYEVGCLFDIENDPCENMNLITTRPDKVAELQARLDYHMQRSVPPSNMEWDTKYGDPKRWNDTWINFCDYSPGPYNH